MYDNRTKHLNLPLPHLLNEIDEDCSRFGEAFTALDAHAEATDTRLDGVEGRAATLEAGVSGLEARSAQNEADAAAYGEQTDAALSGLAGRATALEGRASELEGGVTALAARAEQDEAELVRLDEDKATKAALAAHDANDSAHDALVQRITVGNLSPVIGVALVETGGGTGLWCNVDAEGQPISPTRRYFDYHPTYNALRRVLVDGQVMEEHHKFYYKAMTISSGPFQGKACRLICPGQQDGFKPFPSFMRNGAEVDTWYCGTYAATNEGGSPVKIGSRPGKAPVVSLSFPTMQTYCANRNSGGVSGFGMWDIYQASEIQLLALIEAATPDVQPVFGRGRVDTSSAGTVDATDVATATWRGHVGLWGNVWQMVDGVDVDTAGNLQVWNNNGSRQFVNTGYVLPVYNGSSPAYMMTLKSGKGSGFDFDDIFIPATTTTTAALGTFPDYFYGRSGSSGNVLYLGGCWNYGAGAGLFCLNFAHPASHAYTAIGCRLAKQ